MSKEKMFISKSETIGAPEIRKLQELGSTLNRILTHDEFVAIATVYHSALTRLLIENDEPVTL